MDWNWFFHLHLLQTKRQIQSYAQLNAARWT